MNWRLFQWTWRLEGPLFIGTTPAGSLNRCRLYVPARVLWGAITAESARSEKTTGFPNYRAFGENIAKNCRFTYLFPAERQKKEKEPSVWTPRFSKKNGLQWHSPGKKEIRERDFRRRLLDSRPGTAITPTSNTASEGSLRETECINPWWRSLDNQGYPNPVELYGYVFLKNNLQQNFWQHISPLFVGGDTRYGLGKISLLNRTEISGNNPYLFGKEVHLNTEEPTIQTNIVLEESAL